MARARARARAPWRGGTAIHSPFWISALGLKGNMVFEQAMAANLMNVKGIVQEDDGVVIILP
jgi:hypothetical protein